MFNNTASHAIPSIINSVSNMFASLYLQEAITVISHPLKYTGPLTGKRGETIIPKTTCFVKRVCISEFDYSSFGGSMFLGFVYVIAPLSASMEMIEDREVRIGAK
jgi:hypothetical protein